LTRRVDPTRPIDPVFSRAMTEPRPRALSQEERAAYDRDGFVLLRERVRTDRLAVWSERFEEHALERVPRPKKMTVMKDIEVVKGATAPPTPLHAINKLLSFEDDPVLWSYAVDPDVLAAVRSIVGDALYSISSNVFNKPPGVDGRHPLHQDLRYFALRPAEKIVATWTAIDRCTRENGCLAVVPGSHRGELGWHREPDWDHVNSGFFALDDIDLDARVHVEMEAGDMLLFHPLLVHGSGRNRSDGFRRAISTHYAAADCERPDQPRKRPPVMRFIAADEGLA